MKLSYALIIKLMMVFCAMPLMGVKKTLDGAQKKSQSKQHKTPRKNRIVAENKEIFCFYACGLRFETYNQVRRHEIVVHEQTWVCSKCGLVLPSSNEYNKHELCCSGINRQKSKIVRLIATQQQPSNCSTEHKGAQHNLNKNVQQEPETPMSEDNQSEQLENFFVDDNSESVDQLL